MPWSPKKHRRFNAWPFLFVKSLLLIFTLGLPTLAFAAPESHTAIDLTTSPVGYFALKRGQVACFII